MGYYYAWPNTQFIQIYVSRICSPRLTQAEHKTRARLQYFASFYLSNVHCCKDMAHRVGLPKNNNNLFGKLSLCFIIFIFCIHHNTSKSLYSFLYIRTSPKSSLMSPWRTKRRVRGYLFTPTCYLSLSFLKLFYMPPTSFLLQHNSSVRSRVIFNKQCRILFCFYTQICSSTHKTRFGTSVSKITFTCSIEFTHLQAFLYFYNRFTCCFFSV